MLLPCHETDLTHLVPLKRRRGKRVAPPTPRGLVLELDRMDRYVPGDRRWVFVHTKWGGIDYVGIVDESLLVPQGTIERRDDYIAAIMAEARGGPLPRWLPSAPGQGATVKEPDRSGGEGT